MDAPVTPNTESDEVFFQVRTGVAAELLMVHFEIHHRAAGLAAPAIAPEYLLAERVVSAGV